MSDSQKERLYLNNVIFSYGLAILINISFYEEFSDEEIGRLIGDARKIFVNGVGDQLS